MEAKGCKYFSSKSVVYQAHLGYSIEDIRPAGGIKTFKSATYCNISLNSYCARKPSRYLLAFS
ncbi:hypothetical protein MKW92_004215 [Papaver armeniacum]|nr:hypothetical protein MKW92_004215 [Papaver armeniacum]